MIYDITTHDSVIYDSSIHLFIDVFADTARRQLLVWKDFIKVGEVRRGAMSA